MYYDKVRTYQFRKWVVAVVASHFTIHRLIDEADWEDIVERFNDEKEEDKQYTVKENNERKTFTNISDYRLYTRAAKTVPDWSKILEELVTDLGNISNTSHSYVLFLEVDDSNFAVTGGSGYQVIGQDKQYQFGIDLLSRLVEPNETVIKSVSDRYFSGNILGGNYQLKGKGTINNETEFNNFFNEIYIALSSKTIKEKLDIDIKTKKADYRFLAKDSIKLGKAITLNELDKLLGSILDLLAGPGYPINPFYQLNSDDPLNKKLDDYLAEVFIDYVAGGRTSPDLTIVPLDSAFDTQYIQINENSSAKINYDVEEDIFLYLNEELTFDKEIDVIISIIKGINLTGIIDGEEPVTSSLYNHIDVKLNLDDDTYWLMNGNWYFLESQFMKDIDIKFVERISQSFDLDFTIDSHPLNNWNDGSETNFNFGHNENSSIYVLDRILYENIEICDLLVETDDKLYFIHVKDGIDGNVRVLTDQIIHGMQLISGAKYHSSDVLKGYYKSIVDKIQEDGEEDTSQISIAARKFKERFEEGEFIKVIRDKKICFVFAYRPLDSHDLHRPETIKSTAAKLSMISLIEEKNKYDFDLKFLNIKREPALLVNRE